MRRRHREGKNSFIQGDCHPGGFLLIGDMESWLSDFWSHLHTVEGLSQTIQAGGISLMCLIIFAETGLVVTPFLPGDSLLFAAGALSAAEGSQINVHVMALLLFVCAVIGDSLNYWIGSRVGPAVFKREDSLFLRKKQLERARAFFAKYGGRAVVLARFVPVVRTFVPFVAGIGKRVTRTVEVQQS
jgi:membrane-associated protein